MTYTRMTRAFTVAAAGAAAVLLGLGGPAGAAARTVSGPGGALPVKPPATVYVANIGVDGPGLSVNGRLQFGFPYFPLSLLLAMPGQLLTGDHRYAQLVALELAAILMAFAQPKGFGPIAAALFLREFTENVPWAHLDIAGPAYNEAGPFGYTPKGGTGFGVRTLVRLAETYTR